MKWAPQRTTSASTKIGARWARSRASIRNPQKPAPEATFSSEPAARQIRHIVKEGDLIELGSTRIEVFAVPGHTPGSVAYLARGVLFLGDSADFADDGLLEPAAWLFCADPAQNKASLIKLAKQLSTRREDVKAIACSHSGVATLGLKPLTELAKKLVAKESR